MAQSNSLKIKSLFIVLHHNNKYKPLKLNLLNNGIKDIKIDKVIDKTDKVEEIDNKDKDIDKSNKDKEDKIDNKKLNNKFRNLNKRRDMKEAICLNKISQDYD